MGRIRDVDITLDSASTGVGLTAAQKAGLRYEAKAQIFLKSMLHRYYEAPIIEYSDDTGPRKCVPDGLCFHANDHIVIFEIKIQHMPEAWHQLRRLYEPVMRARFPHKSISCVEVVRTYDPAVRFPEELEIIKDLPSFCTLPVGVLGVFEWRG